MKVGTYISRQIVFLILVFDGATMLRSYFLSSNMTVITPFDFQRPFSRDKLKQDSLHVSVEWIYFNNVEFKQNLKMMLQWRQTTNWFLIQSTRFLTMPPKMETFKNLRRTSKPLFLRYNKFPSDLVTFDDDTEEMITQLLHFHLLHVCHP